MFDSHFSIIPNRVIRCTKLSLQERVTVINILSWRQPKNGETWIYNEQLAKGVGCDIRQLQRVTSALKRKGAIDKWKVEKAALNYKVIESFFDDVESDDADGTEHHPAPTESCVEAEQQDGKEYRPQDGNEHHPQDGTGYRPQDGTEHQEGMVTSTTQEKTLNKTTAEKTTEENNCAEKTLSRSASEACFAGETESVTPPCPSDSKGDEPMNLNLIPESSHRDRYIKLITIWQQHSPLILTDKILLTCHKLMGIEEKKTGYHLDPETVVPLALARKLLFTALFQARGSAFVWNELQGRPATSPASGEAWEGEGGVDATESLPASPAGRELARAARKTKGKNQPWPEDKVLEIYQAYPRKVSRGAALPAIHKALTIIKDSSDLGDVDPVPFLLDRVTQYAAARVGEDPKYTPHCATWMNQMRFMDDTSAWQNKPRDRTGNIERIIDDTPHEPSKPISNEDVWNI